MSQLKLIRQRLGLTQNGLGKVMGCVQGNVTAYERDSSPREIPRPRAQRLIAYANEKGLPLTFDHVYGAAPLPELEAA